jgi:hypothetical protein
MALATEGMAEQVLLGRGALEAPHRLLSRGTKAFLAEFGHRLAIAMLRPTNPLPTLPNGSRGHGMQRLRALVLI